MTGISLTASARANLLSLQSTSQLLDQTQNRLSTGKKVNSATDNAVAFFASASFLSRAGDLSNVKDGLGTALQTVKAASNGIDAVTKIIQQAQGLAAQAAQLGTDTAGLAGRKALGDQYAVLSTQLDNVVKDSTFNGINLLNGDKLTVNFNESNSSSLDVGDGTTKYDSAGLGISTVATNDFAANTDIKTDTDKLATALTTLRSAASSFGSNSTLIQNRSDFTDATISALQVASDNLVLADTNEEGANLQSLQARLQLGVTALGISGQETQAILKLF